MRILIIIYFILFITNILLSSSLDNSNNYSESLYLLIAKSTSLYTNEMRIYVIPYNFEDNIFDQYDSWIKKRYSKNKIIDFLKECIKNNTNGQNISKFNLIVENINQSFGTGYFTLPNDFIEYIFLENDKGLFSRCYSMVGHFEICGEVTLFFSNYCDTNSKINLYDNSKFIKVVITHDIFNNYSAKFDLPLSNIYTNAPKEIADLFYEIGVWKK